METKMVNKRNNLGILTAMLVLVMSVVSCDNLEMGNGNDNAANPFVGTWVYSIAFIPISRCTFNADLTGTTASGGAFTYTYSEKTAKIFYTDDGTTDTAYINGEGKLIIDGYVCIKQ
jgi:hypothetical protein